MKDFVFVTGNKHKLKWLEEFIGHKVDSSDIDLDEIQELDHSQVVKFKAIQAYSILKKPILIEDTALSFNSLGRLPGTFIKWFIKDLGLPKIVKLLDGFEDKYAVASVIFCYYDGKDFQIFEGNTSGWVVSPKGEYGHGWDSIFQPEGSDKTLAEMTTEEYTEYSARKKAVIKLKEFVEEV